MRIASLVEIVASRLRAIRAGYRVSLVSARSPRKNLRSSGGNSPGVSGCLGKHANVSRGGAAIRAPNCLC